LVRALRFLGSDSSPRSYFFSFPPGLFGVWVFLFYFLLLAVFFSFNLLIANPTVGGYFFLVLPRFVCISLATFCQSVVDVVLHLIVQFEKSRLLTRNLKTLSGESGSSRQFMGDGRL